MKELHNNNRNCSSDSDFESPMLNYWFSLPIKVFPEGCNTRRDKEDRENGDLCGVAKIIIPLRHPYQAPCKNSKCCTKIRENFAQKWHSVVSKSVVHHSTNITVPLRTFMCKKPSSGNADPGGIFVLFLEKLAVFQESAMTLTGTQNTTSKNFPGTNVHQNICKNDCRNSWHCEGYGDLLCKKQICKFVCKLTTICDTPHSWQNNTSGWSRWD